MTAIDPPRLSALILAAKRLIAATLISFGMVLLAFGNWWAPWFLSVLAAIPGGSWLELILPFLPMAVIGCGAVILTRS
jgi:hypothetical protein